MILRARVLSPIDPQQVAWWPDARVEFNDRGRIVDVRAWSGGPCDEDLREGVLTPGFVDAHVHFPQLRIVGSASGPLLDWLADSTFPEESRFADVQHARQVAGAFTRALASAGTTLAFVYGAGQAVANQVLFSALDRSGLKAIAGPVLMDEHVPQALAQPATQSLDALSDLAQRWHGHDDRLQVAVIPRFALSCSAALMRDAAAFAQGGHLWVSTHLAETAAECAAVQQRFGVDYLQVYERAGLLHDKAVFAHCIHLDAPSWQRLADADAVVAHCPDSNDFLGSGGMPIGTVLDGGIPMALGTDVAAGRTFRVPRVASSAHDNALRHQRREPPERWFWTATRGGALALGHEGTGAIEPGLDADLVWHDVPAWVTDGQGALAWILFHHDAPLARATWVRGRKVWQRAHGSYPWVEA